MSQASLSPSVHLRNHSHRNSRSDSEKLDGCLPDFECLQRTNGIWTPGKLSLKDLYVMRDVSPEIVFIFLPTETDLISVGAHKSLSRRFSIPESFWTSLALKASGFFGSQEDRDEIGAIESYSSQFRFLVKQPGDKQPTFPKIGVPYTWHRLGFSTQWSPSSSVVLCFDLPASFKSSLMDTLMATHHRLGLHDPFAVHNVLVGEIVELFDTALWSWRDLVRDMEQNRTSEGDPQPDFILMHEMARHAIHSSEMLAMAIETLTSITQEHEIFFADDSKTCKRDRQVEKDLRYHSTLFKSLHFRSKALEERLRNEINLAFNVVAQNDSRVSMKIADATQVDSAAMKTIAMLGLVFFPGTFICAIFSTSFFSFSPGSDGEPQTWTISEYFWIYWVVAIPVTGITVLFWYSWQNYYARRSILKQS